jgi:hypothetical protein
VVYRPETWGHFGRIRRHSWRARSSAAPGALGGCSTSTRPSCGAHHGITAGGITA